MNTITFTFNRDIIYNTLGVFLMNTATHYENIFKLLRPRKENFQIKKF